MESVIASKRASCMTLSYRGPGAGPQARKVMRSLLEWDAGFEDKSAILPCVSAG